jgi:hypothetical protein
MIPTKHQIFVAWLAGYTAARGAGRARGVARSEAEETVEDLLAFEMHTEDQDHRSQPERIMSALERSERPMRPKEVALLTGIPSPSVSSTLRRLLRAGKIVRPSRGAYQSVSGGWDVIKSRPPENAP